MQAPNFQTIFLQYQSPDNSIRAQAESQLNSIITNPTPTTLDYIFASLTSTPSSETNLKLFLSLLIKKIIDSTTSLPSSSSSKLSFIEYFSSRRTQIIEAIINNLHDIKTLNILILCLNNLILLLTPSSPSIFFDIFAYAHTQYNQTKVNQTQTLNTRQYLILLYQLLKFTKKIDIDIVDNSSIYKMLESIINDYENIANVLLTVNTLDIYFEYVVLYMKICKYSLNYLLSEYREKIMTVTYGLFNKICAVLFPNTATTTTTNIVYTTNSSSSYDVLFDIVFLCNKTLLKYAGYSNKIDTNTIEKFANMFYIYITNHKHLQSLLSVIPSQYKQSKFIIHIIDFFKELLQLTDFTNWGELVIFKDCYSDNSIQICDYLNMHFFTNERITNILLFAIKHCLTFTISEITMAQNDYEEFYTWYDTLSFAYDLRAKAGLLCRIIYEKYRKEIKPIYKQLETELLSLTTKEMEQLVQSGKTLSYEETNLKCAILSHFEAICIHYFNDKRDYNKWIYQILLSQLDVNMINMKGSEIFSKFIIMRILHFIIDNKCVQPYKNEIFMKVYNVFISNNNLHSFEMILNLSAVEFFRAFIDDILPVEFPNGFIENYICKICEMLKATSNPDIHCKIIEVTGLILKKFDDDKIDKAFPVIFPILKYLWDNNWNEYVCSKKESEITKSKLQTASLSEKYNATFTLQKINTSIFEVRKNLIKLISIFVKRVGLFIKFDTTVNETSVVNEQYFNFIYNVIGYSLSVNSEEAVHLLPERLRLILLIQDEFIESTSLGNYGGVNIKINELKHPLHECAYFPYFMKLYDYVNIVLENLNSSNDYFMVQLFIIEQYISLSGIPLIAQFLDNMNVVDKIIFVLNKLISNSIHEYHQIIFNIIEYILFIINCDYCALSTTSKVKYNEWVFNIISTYFNNNANVQLVAQLLPKIIENTQSDNMKDSSELSIYLGIIQLSNRLLYINYTMYQSVSIDFCEEIISKIKVVLPYVDKGVVSFIGKSAIAKAIALIREVYKERNYISNNSAFINAVNVNDIARKEEYLNRNDAILGSYLYFFNKVLTSDYYLNLTAEEDKLRLLWNDKLNKMSFDYSDIQFKVKYYLLNLDKMTV